MNGLDALGQNGLVAPRGAAGWIKCSASASGLNFDFL
jgi:hypothetical protein